MVLSIKPFRHRDSLRHRSSLGRFMPLLPSCRSLSDRRARYRRQMPQRHVRFQDDALVAESPSFEPSVWCYPPYTQRHDRATSPMVPPYDPNIPRHDLPSHPLSCIYALRSWHSFHPTNITFINTRPTTAHLWWYDYQGVPVYYGPIYPHGGRVDVRTYLSQPWVVTDDFTRQVLGSWYPATWDGRVLLC